MAIPKPRASLNVTIDEDGKVWQYAPNQPGGLVQVGTVTKESDAKTDNERNTLKKERDEARKNFSEALKETNHLRADNDHLKDRIRTLQAKVKEVEEELADAKKPRRK